MQSYRIGERKTQKKKGGIKLGRVIIFAIFVFILYKITFGSIQLDKRVVITKGDGFSEFIQDFSTLKKLGIKIQLKMGKSDLDIQKISEGNYDFSGVYSQVEFLNAIAQGPKTSYTKYTVLEGWSIYDIDYDLTNKNLIHEGEYIDFVTDSTYISKYQNRYEFLSKAGKIDTLEGFLYPDTYNLDSEGNIIDQLVYLQLDNFKTRVRDKYSDQIQSFSKLSWIDIVTMASIIEKEEKSSTNRPVVAGIFINRLDQKMLLGADITLCYGLKQPYETCTPSLIAKKVSDKSNIYNTRQNPGLTKTPISNPSVDSISAVLNYSNTDYLFYLHDNSGIIHYGKTNEEHVANKNMYLK